MHAREGDGRVANTGGSPTKTDLPDTPCHPPWLSLKMFLRRSMMRSAPPGVISPMSPVWNHCWPLLQAGRGTARARSGRGQRVARAGARPRHSL